MWYFVATWFVMSSICWSSFLSLWIRHTSSIHSSESIFVPAAVVTPWFLFLSSFDISSMSVAYSTTDSTPPCLMLSLNGISLLRPNLVWILAVRLLLSFFMMLRFLPSTPFFIRTYRIASSQALLYAFCTSKNTTYVVSFLLVISFTVCLRTIGWSTVELPSIPPAWALVMTTCCLTLSLMILSYTFPTLLTSVIPHLLEHFPFFFHFPLYNRIISPFSQLGGISSVECILL